MILMVNFCAVPATVSRTSAEMPFVQAWHAVRRPWIKPAMPFALAGVSRQRQRLAFDLSPNNRFGPLCRATGMTGCCLRRRLQNDSLQEPFNR